jgi:acylglycerol lipase
MPTQKFTLDGTGAATTVWHETTPVTCRGLGVVMHGLGEHSERHRNTINFLLGFGFDVVRFDFRGCGESPGARQWIERFQNYVDDASNVINWAANKKPAAPLFIFGHSLGGTIAIMAAAELHMQLKGLVLTAPAYLPGNAVSPIKIRIGRLLNHVTPRLKIPAALDLSAISRDPQVVAAYREDPLNCRFNTVRQGNEILDALPKLPEYCAKINIPTLIVHGDADRLVLADGSRRLATAFAKNTADLIILPGVVHEPHNDWGQATYFDALSAWLSRQI